MFYKENMADPNYKETGIHNNNNNYLFEAIDKAIADHENDNSVIVGCYITITGLNSGDRWIKYEYNGSTFVECPELIIRKRII